MAPKLALFVQMSQLRPWEDENFISLLQFRAPHHYSSLLVCGNLLPARLSTMTRNPKSKTRPIAGVTTCLNVKTQHKRLVKNPTPNKLYGLYSLGGEVGLGGFSFSPVELPGATVQKEV